MRPSVPPLVWCAAGVWSGVCVGSLAVWHGAAAGRLVPTSLLAGAAVIVIAATAPQRLRRMAHAITPVVVAFTLGLACGTLHATWTLAQGLAVEAVGPREWSGVVASDPTVTKFGTRVTVALLDDRFAGRALLDWPKGAASPPYGSVLRFAVRFKAVQPADATAIRDFTAGVIATGKPWRVVRRGWESGPRGWAGALRAQALRALEGATGAGPRVVASAVFGRRDSQDEETFRAAGAAHLLMAAGMHLAIVAAMCGMLARLTGLGRRAVVVASVAGALGFTLVGGLRVSLVRAAAVACCGLVPSLTLRRRSALGGGAAGVVVVCALDPPAAWDAALWVGVAAVAGIALLGVLAQRWASAALPGRWRWVARVVGSALAVQVALAPLAAALFGTLTPLAPASAVLLTPGIELAVVLAAFGASVLPMHAALGRAVLQVAAVPAALSARMAQLLASASGAVLASDVWSTAALAAWLLAAAALWVWWPRPRRVWRVRAGASVVCGLLVLSIFGTRPSAPQVVVLDVGQGDAILVRDGRAAMLVDTGPDPLSLRRALARVRVRHLDELVLTHAHADHTGGMRGLAGIASAGWVGVPDVAEPFPTETLAEAARVQDGGGIRPLRAGMDWDVGSWHARVLWPAGGERRLATNDTSVILLLTRPGATVILLGDAEERAQQGALGAYSGTVDVLKAAHHGSVNGAIEEALASWQPHDVLISVGAGNSFGHPHAQALRAFAAIGAGVWRTDLSGDLTVTGVGQGYRVGSAHGASVACATMRPIGYRQHQASVPTVSAMEARGRGTVRSQACASHLRLRGAAARARGPPPA